MHYKNFTLNFWKWDLGSVVSKVTITRPRDHGNQLQDEWWIAQSEGLYQVTWRGQVSKYRFRRTTRDISYRLIMHLNIWHKVMKYLSLLCASLNTFVFILITLLVATYLHISLPYIENVIGNTRKCTAQNSVFRIRYIGTV